MSSTTNVVKTDNLFISNQDAVSFIKSLPDNTFQCIICDPPFGISEDKFDKHYARNSEKVIQGYSTAPTDSIGYQDWVKLWVQEIPRILKANGTFYVVCSWNHVCDVEMAIRTTNLTVVNHIIWKYNFGVYTQRKFISSHYHILRCAVGKNIPTFYNRAYFNETDKTSDGKSLQYADMEDVWIIPKEFSKGEKKNVNKLPNELVRKMILYSSQPDDWVGDFFLGNFTSAYVARSEGRRFMGCEINKMVYLEHYLRLSEMPYNDTVVSTPCKVSTKPKNSGKRITQDEKKKIIDRYNELLPIKKTKKECLIILQSEFERGHFSIINILKSNSL